MIIHNIEQGTDEWKILKAGKFSASKFGKLFMGKTTKGYNGYLNDIAIERLTGEPVPSYKNSWMDRGNILESEARETYELKTWDKVQTVGFVELDEWIGVSPDGLVGNDGGIEIKCLGSDAFAEVKLNGTVDKDHLYQMQGCMWVCEREWCDYVVYYPGLSLFIKRIPRDETIIKSIQNEIEIAKIEVIKRMDLLK